MPTEAGMNVTAVKAERRDLMLALMKEEAPAVLMLELYPFGRKAFSV